jgi:hypothetical protein
MQWLILTINKINIRWSHGRNVFEFTFLRSVKFISNLKPLSNIENDF